MMVETSIMALGCCEPLKTKPKKIVCSPPFKNKAQENILWLTLGHRANLREKLQKEQEREREREED